MIVFRPVRRILSRAPLSTPLPAAMNARFPLLAAAALSFLSLAPAQAATIAPGGTFCENFDGIGTSATATLPSGWKVVNSSSARAVTQSLYESAASTTGEMGTGSGNSNGIYNWENAADATDRAVGFLASGTATKTGNLYLILTASGAIPDFTISYDMKCFRNNTREFQFQLYYSTDAGVTWTSAGSSFCTTYATSSSGVVVNPAGVTSVSSQPLNVALSAGGTIVFCWSYSVPSGTTTSNAQGLGIDNVVIVAGKNQSGLTALDAPDNVLASNENFTSFTLSWDSVSGATGYNVAVQNANGATVFSTQCSALDTTALVTGLTPGETYTAYVTALGDGTTSDDSAAAMLSDIETLPSVPLSAPTNLHTTNIEFYEASVAWDGVADATGYTVTIAPSAGTSVSDNGTTATLSGLAEGATYTVSVVANGNGVETADSPATTLSVTTATAPAVTEPVLSFTGVSSSAFTVSWPAQSSASFSVRAWRIAPTDSFTESFSDWLNTPGTLPSGWSKEGGLAGRYTVSESPVKFEETGHALTSPVFPGSITSLAFVLRQYSGKENNASTFSVYGSSGEDGATWTLLRAIDLFTEVSTSGTDFSLVVPAGIHQFRFTYTKGAGNCGFGGFEVSGTDVCEVPFYLQGYGPEPTYLAEAATTCTISNPAAGETNYVEVTAWGLTGRSAVSVGTVVPRDRPAVISVK